jgi:hypothetical protein
MNIFKENQKSSRKTSKINKKKRKPQTKKLSKPILQNKSIKLKRTEKWKQSVKVRVFQWLIKKQLRYLELKDLGKIVRCKFKLNKLQKSLVLNVSAYQH